LTLPDRLIHIEETDSTNSEARRLAEAGERGPVWIMAERQTAGRGRRGRSWEQGKGNLAATLLLAPGRSDVAQLSFAAALATADTARRFAPQAHVTVKWPNDVLADGKKLAGILLESGQGWLAVGIGINLAHHPDGTEFPATALAKFVTPPSPEEARAVLAACFGHWYDIWMIQGFEILRAAWLAHAGGLGAPIRARLASHETRHGVFEGIDASGALLLNEQGRISAIAAAEVFF
jgi:BirA family biotin operon repressor/biotin-[acetyl-CoA-carboxylase] ligase